MEKKGQTGGLVTGLVFGIASLVIGVIVAFVLVSTLTGAGLLEGSRNTGTVTNETGWLNATAYSLDSISSIRLDYSITALWVNTSTVYELIPVANYSLSTSGVVTRLATEDYSDALYSYTYLEQSVEEQATNKMSGNFTDGVNEVSSKLPTILLIAAIVLILGVLAVLVGVWQRMKMGGGQL